MAGEAAKPKEFAVPGAVKTNEGEGNSREALYTQLEKSSISLFKMMPSGVMIVEPQDKLIAMRE